MSYKFWDILLPKIFVIYVKYKFGHSVFYLTNLVSASPISFFISLEILTALKNE